MTAWAERLDLSDEYVRTKDVAVAVVDGRLAGFAALVAREGECELDDLWVLPEHIGTGLGRRLFEWARNRAEQLGAARLRLDAGARRGRLLRADGRPRRRPYLDPQRAVDTRHVPGAAVRLKPLAPDPPWPTGGQRRAAGIRLRPVTYGCA